MLKKKEELKQFPFAGLFLELRNIGIHQGNRLPIFQFEFTSRAGSIYKITWSPEYHEVIEYGVKISDKDQELVETKAAPNISEEEFVDLFLQELIDISKVVFSKDAINSWKKTSGSLILDDDHTMSFNEFLDTCQQYVAALERIVTEAVDHFPPAK